jgi:hypothetical protein
MRTFVHNMAFICMALLLSISTSTAIAAENSSHPSLCYSQWNILANNGYSPNATYSAGDIMQLLRNVQVDANPMYLRSDTNYRLVYNCYITQELAHVSLNAIPVDGVTRLHYNDRYRYAYNGHYRYYYDPYFDRNVAVYDRYNSEGYVPKDRYLHYYDPYFDRNVAVFDRYNRICNNNCTVIFAWTKSR